MRRSKQSKSPLEFSLQRDFDSSGAIQTLGPVNPNHVRYQLRATPGYEISQLWSNMGATLDFDQLPARGKPPSALASQSFPGFWRSAAHRRSHASKTRVLPTALVYHLSNDIILDLYCYGRHCSLQHSLTPRCLTIIENINFVHPSFSSQVDFPVDFTRQNPSRADTNR